MKSVDVAIVGGGPGGLASACAIHKTAPNLKVRVYERAPELRKVGFTLAMLKNGENALGAIDEDLKQNILKHSVVGPLSLYNEGERTKRLPSHNSTPWYMLQSELANWIPDEWLVLGRSLTSLDVQPEGALLQFKCAGDDSEECANAKIVIGADGNQSVARQFILGDGPPMSRNRVVWRGRGKVPSDWPHRSDTSTFLGSGSHKAWFTNLGDGTLLWSAYYSMSAAELETLSTARYVDSAVMGEERGMRKLERCLVRYSDAPDIIQKVIKSSDPGSVTEHGLFYREASDCLKWGKGCATLMGDAAHLMTPLLAQGVNQALEDAVELGRCIGELGPTEEALRRYENIRVKPVSYIHEASVGIATSRIKETEMEWSGRHPEILNRQPESLKSPGRQ